MQFAETFLDGTSCTFNANEQGVCLKGECIVRGKLLNYMLAIQKVMGILWSEETLLQQ